MNESLAQLVEHLTFNEGVVGSSPTRLIFFVAVHVSLRKEIQTSATDFILKSSIWHPLLSLYHFHTYLSKGRQEDPDQIFDWVSIVYRFSRCPWGVLRKNGLKEASMWSAEALASAVVDAGPAGIINAGRAGV